jgi:hypothetical protein
MYCEKPQDALGETGRETVFRVAQAYLEQVRITGIELAFDPREHRKILNAAAKFQEYLQRVAILMGQHSTAPVAERMRHVLATADGAMRLVEAAARVQQNGPPLDAARLDAARLDAARLDALASGAGDSAPADAGVALAFALSSAPPGDWGARGARCLALLTGIQTVPARALLDQILSELLRLKPAQAALVAAPDAPALLVRACLALAGDAESAAAANSPFVAGLVRAKATHKLPRVDRAAVEILNDVLSGPANLAKRDVALELKTTRGLRDKIASLKALSADKDLADNLSRRMSRLVAPESLDPLIAREPGIGRKLHALLALYGEIDDPAARKHLAATIETLTERRDFKDEFFAPGLAHDEKRALAAQTLAAFDASALPEMRKLRYREVAALAFASLGDGGERRIAPRMMAGPEDRVQLFGQRVPLRNWSETGLLFGPFSGALAPGQRLRGTVQLRNAYLSLAFDCDVEIVRFVDGLVGARYACADPHARQRIKAHFRA